MFKGVLDYTKQLEIGADFTQAFLYKLRGGRRRVINSITKAEEQVKFARNETKYVASLKPKIQKEAIKFAKEALFISTINALKKRQEFDIPLYRKPLFESIADNDTYKIRSRGSGFNSIISVNINLDATAGRLNMWGSAIKIARKILGVKVPTKRSSEKKRTATALQASRAWAGIYDKRGGKNKGKYDETIKLRLSKSSKPAPFWELLDKGALPMPSDRGGYPTPNNLPLNFVDKTEKEINTAISRLFLDKKEEYKGLFIDFDVFMQEAQERLIRLNEMVDKVSLNVRITKQLERELGLEEQDISRNKLEKAVQLIREGLITGGRINITAKGSRKRRGLSVNIIKELLY